MIGDAATIEDNCATLAQLLDAVVMLSSGKRDSCQGSSSTGHLSARSRTVLHERLLYSRKPYSVRDACRNLGTASCLEETYQLCVTRRDAETCRHCDKARRLLETPASQTSRPRIIATGSERRSGCKHERQPPQRRSILRTGAVSRLAISLECPAREACW
jgi:hypothetical protein